MAGGPYFHGHPFQDPTMRAITQAQHMSDMLSTVRSPADLPRLQAMEAGRIPSPPLSPFGAPMPNQAPYWYGMQPRPRWYRPFQRQIPNSLNNLKKPPHSLFGQIMWHFGKGMVVNPVLGFFNNLLHHPFRTVGIIAGFGVLIGLTGGIAGPVSIAAMALGLGHGTFSFFAGLKKALQAFSKGDRQDGLIEVERMGSAVTEDAGSMLALHGVDTAIGAANGITKGNLKWVDAGGQDVTDSVGSRMFRSWNPLNWGRGIWGTFKKLSGQVKFQDGSNIASRKSVMDQSLFRRMRTIAEDDDYSSTRLKNQYEHFMQREFSRSERKSTVDAQITWLKDQQNKTGLSTKVVKRNAKALEMAERHQKAQAAYQERQAAVRKFLTGRSRRSRPGWLRGMRMDKGSDVQETIKRLDEQIAVQKEKLEKTPDSTRRNERNALIKGMEDLREALKPHDQGAIRKRVHDAFWHGIRHRGPNPEFRNVDVRDMLEDAARTHFWYNKKAPAGYHKLQSTPLAVSMMGSGGGWYDSDRL